MAETSAPFDPASEEPGWTRRQSGGVLLWAAIAFVAGLLIGVWVTWSVLRGAPASGPAPGGAPPAVSAPSSATP